MNRVALLPGCEPLPKRPSSSVPHYGHTKLFLGGPEGESDRTTSSRLRMPACVRLIALFASWEQPFECADPWLLAVGYEPLADPFKLIYTPYPDPETWTPRPKG